MIGLGLSLTVVAARQRAAAGGGGQTSLQILTAIGHHTNLLYCLDPGDGASYGGSGQVWSDVSAADNDFVRGADTDAGSNDPTFVGVAGAGSINEAFSSDGGDFFTEAAAAWGDDAFHQAGATYTLMSIFFAPTGFADGPLTFFANQNRSTTTGANAGKGICFYLDGGRPVFYMGGADIDTGHVVLTDSTAVWAENKWHCATLAYDADEESGVYLALNNVGDAHAHVDAPTTGNAASAARIGANGDGSNPAPNGTKFGPQLAWSVTKTPAEVYAILQAFIAARYTEIPLLPPELEIGEVGYEDPVLTFFIGPAGFSFEEGDTVQTYADDVAVEAPHVVTGGEAMAGSIELTIDPFVDSSQARADYIRDAEVFATTGNFGLG